MFYSESPIYLQFSAVWLSSRKRARSPYPKKSAFYFPNQSRHFRNKTTTFRPGVDMKRKNIRGFPAYQVGMWSRWARRRCRCGQSRSELAPADGSGSEGRPREPFLPTRKKVPRCYFLVVRFIIFFFQISGFQEGPYISFPNFMQI
jgi:hypothetical protein